ncbi:MULTISPECIES: hypothetical protein [Paracoccaceae]|jgi:hypothetical protein|uniref:hypothetical protein n=1 Tax=Rhodobacterales TaxID=204455 RepID=UPI001B1E6C62|nr:hypothetical protein [Boseongicola sp. H5]MBO6603989.1 hypothetical protein [Roseicyclus sp.]MBO6625590.1 hypothetical protein [Roseicyclus sp.]MBO6921748.1 hypothetical protein [Roseicyclus sp.]
MMRDTNIPAKSRDSRVDRDDWVEVRLLVAAMAGLSIVLGVTIAGLVEDIRPANLTAGALPAVYESWSYR